MGMILREAEVVYKGRRIDASRRVAVSADAAKIFTEWGIADRAQECFSVMYLNAKHQCLAVQMVGLGSVTSVAVHPREVFRGAILAGAVAIILGHNHPSGDPTPSSDDVSLTRRMVEVGNLLGTPVLDHIVIAQGGEYQSLAEQGLM